MNPVLPQFFLRSARLGEDLATLHHLGAGPLGGISQDLTAEHHIGGHGINEVSRHRCQHEDHARTMILCSLYERADSSSAGVRIQPDAPSRVARSGAREHLEQPKVVSPMEHTKLVVEYPKEGCLLQEAHPATGESGQRDDFLIHIVGDRAVGGVVEHDNDVRLQGPPS